MNPTELVKIYNTKYSSPLRVFRSPGRINIIGEHTDYNEGFVLPAAVDKEIILVLGLNGSDKYKIYSKDYNAEISFTKLNYKSIKIPWAQYLLGIFDVLLEEGFKIPGFDCVFGGDIPIGSGMSSSAALECAGIYALNETLNLGLTKERIALLAQKAENQYVGVQCGIMDQYASVLSKKDQAIKLDCLDLSLEKIPVDLNNYQFILVNSMVKHSLASSDYNVRQIECQNAIETFQQKDESITSLRQVDYELLMQSRNRFSESIFGRCHHVVTESMRVHKASEALKNGDLKLLGQLMYESHDSLSHDYEVSCVELDYLVDVTKSSPEILGSRMMGGGFGGCTLNLVNSSIADKFIQRISENYGKKFDYQAICYKVKTADGSSEIILK